ncbi:hypothetical protein [Acidovorax sp. sic0104]|uniref:hypothetical protein n=1 Tax=Acidovorax sp. sic0104 TaxID=2854784 RepID=UPI001C47FE90|nr:hypothetical protein [Acidovorax sp. sic0104]MBV7542209.1 hypothetical protein [Acidovorax sp. sic0104]
MDLNEFEPIERAPRDGTPVILACEGHPEFGSQLMAWSGANRRWEGHAFALLRKVPSWWDGNAASAYSLQARDMSWEVATAETEVATRVMACRLMSCSAIQARLTVERFPAKAGQA